MIGGGERPPAREFVEQKRGRLQRQIERGRPSRFKDIGRREHFYLMPEAATFLVQHNLHEKVLSIDRFRFDHIEGKRTHRNVAPGDIEYRFGYWILKKIGRDAGKWGWAQFAPLIPARDLRPLINLAIKEGPSGLETRRRSAPINGKRSDSLSLKHAAKPTMSRRVRSSELSAETSSSVARLKP